MNNIKIGENVLVIWKNSTQDDIGNLVNQIKGISGGNIVLENADMITECEELLPLNIFKNILFCASYNFDDIRSPYSIST